jgi:hypothetical protein
MAECESAALITTCNLHHDAPQISVTSASPHAMIQEGSHSSASSAAVIDSKELIIARRGRKAATPGLEHVRVALGRLYDANFRAIHWQQFLFL